MVDLGEMLPAGVSEVHVLVQPSMIRNFIELLKH